MANIDALEAEKRLLSTLITELKHRLVAVDLAIENELEVMALWNMKHKNKGLPF